MLVSLTDTVTSNICTPPGASVSMSCRVPSTPGFFSRTITAAAPALSAWVATLRKRIRSQPARANQGIPVHMRLEESPLAVIFTLVPVSYLHCTPRTPVDIDNDGA